MADDIRLVIGVEQSGLLKAITNTESLEAKVKKLSAAYARDAASYGRYNKAIGDLAKATNRNKKELLDYGKALRADEKATKKATAEVKAFTLARKQATEEDRRRTSEKKIAVKATEDLARAEAKNAASLKSMRMATDAVYRNQQKRLQMKKLLKAAIVAETMTTEQAIVALKRYNAAQMSSTKVMGMAKNRMNGNNMAIQQLGYQFGDFAVQVQGGTSAFVAFSQQGAQLAGILPMVAGPLGLSMGAAVGLSAALGVLIPIGSAVGRMFFEMGGSAESSAKATDDLKTALEELKEATEDTSQFMEAALKLPFSAANEELKSLMASYKQMKAELAKDSFATAISPLVYSVADALDKLNKKKANRQAVLDISRGSGTPLSPEMEQKTQAEINSLILMQKEAGSFLTKIQAALKGPSEDLAENLLKVSMAFSASGMASGEMRDQLHLVLAESGMLAEMAELSVKKEKEQAAIKKAIAESEAKLFEEDRKKRNAAEKEYQDRLQRTRVIMGQMRAEKAAGEKKLDAAGDKAILENNARIEIELFKANSKYEKEQAALRLKEQKELNDKVTEMATRLAIPFAAALNLIRQAKAEASVGMDAFGGRGDFKYEDATTFTPEGFGKDPKKTGGGGKTDKEKLAEYLKSKEQEQILEKQLVGVLGEERQIQTELFNIKEKYAGVITPKQEDELENILRLTQAERDRQAVVEEAAAQQQSLSDFIGDSMENAMMGIVDGTLSVKDAFKSMASEIIKELYRVLVVQQMVAAAKFALGGGDLFGGASWSADGDVVGSSGIQAYADGGVVNSPTMFKHGGGLGVMGEAGPEAIMPLKRGANGKLGVQMEGGGGDTINVVQNFSFQANGDDSVKKIIAQAAPQIAQMTKSSLLNDRRRGGATKAAFG